MSLLHFSLSTTHSNIIAPYLPKSKRTEGDLSLVIQNALVDLKVVVQMLSDVLYMALWPLAMRLILTHCVLCITKLLCLISPTLHEGELITLMSII